MRARKAILAVWIVGLVCGLACGQAVNPGRVNVVTTPWSVNWLTHANDAAALTDLGASAWVQTLFPAADRDGLFGLIGTDLQLAQTLAADREIDVRWYGADGVGDDSVPIQAAIDALELAGGGILMFPPGTYTATVTADKTVKFRGSGAGTTTWTAANAGEYALTLSDSGGNQWVEGITFSGAARTKSGIYKTNGAGGGTAALTVRKCTFSFCDFAFRTNGCFYWHFEDCFFVDGNYDLRIDGIVGTMQAATGLIDHCYFSRTQICALRTVAALYSIRWVGGVAENSQGFVAHCTGHSEGYPVLMDGVHLEGNTLAATVDIDGTPTVPYEVYLSGVYDATLRDLKLSSLQVASTVSLRLDDVAIDTATWRYNAVAAAVPTIRATGGTPYSAATAGGVMNDVHHESRRITKGFSRVQIAPGPITDRIDRVQTNLYANGSMERSYTVTAAGGNTVGFSGAYRAPIHGRCMTIAFASAAQAMTDGIRPFPDTTLTTERWYVWSMDVRTVTDPGWLSSCWRPNSNLRGLGMAAYPDRWTRYWGVAYYTEASGARLQWLWNGHATANPTFLVANVQLVQFTTAQEAEQYVNAAAYAPGSADLAPWQYDLSRVYTVAADITDVNAVGTTIFDSTAGPITCALAAGTAVGQRVLFTMKRAGNNVDISVSHHVTSNPEVIRLDAVKEWIELVWDGNDWVEVTGNGQTYP